MQSILTLDVLPDPFEHHYNVVLCTLKKKAQDADTLCRNGIDLDGDDQMGDVHVSRPDKLGWVMATNTTGVTSPAPCPRNKNTREPRRPPKNATAPRHGFLSVPACTQHSFLVAECDRPLPFPCLHVPSSGVQITKSLVLTTFGNANLS
jgi:hypothetical protein